MELTRTRQKLIRMQNDQNEIRNPAQKNHRRFPCPRARPRPRPRVLPRCYLERSLLQLQQLPHLGRVRQNHQTKTKKERDLKTKRRAVRCTSRPPIQSRTAGASREGRRKLSVFPACKTMRHSAVQQLCLWFPGSSPQDCHNHGSEVGSVKIPMEKSKEIIVPWSHFSMCSESEIELAANFLGWP